jgi:hypothetical protein
MPVHNTVFHSPEENNKAKLIGNAYRFASIIFSTTFCLAYLVWNANRLFISSTKLQHNVIIKSE